MMRSDHSTDDDGRVIQFRPRMGTSSRNRGRKAPIRNFERDYSPVPDLAKYEFPESDDEYRHRMIINAIAVVFTSLLILAGLWLANNMVVHA
jgi:hypothetical protein